MNPGAAAMTLSRKYPSIRHNLPKRGQGTQRLDLVERGDVDALDVLLEARDGLLQEVRAHLVVLHHAAAHVSAGNLHAKCLPDLQLLDAVANRHQLRCAPQQPVRLR